MIERPPIVRDSGFVAAYFGLSFPLVEVWSDYVKSVTSGLPIPVIAGADLESYLGPWLEYCAPQAYKPNSSWLTSGVAIRAQDDVESRRRWR